MSNVTHIKPAADPVVVNEDYFKGYSDAQLIYKATAACDLAVDVLFDESFPEQDSFNEARFEVFIAFTALKVLIGRQFGQSYTELKGEVHAAYLRRVLGAKEDGETLQ